MSGVLIRREEFGHKDKEETHTEVRRAHDNRGRN